MTHPAISVPTLIAHRGYSAAAPENTLTAVRAAQQAGATWVELDVQLLKDDTPRHLARQRCEPLLGWSRRACQPHVAAGPAARCRPLVW